MIKQLPEVTTKEAMAYGWAGPEHLCSCDQCIEMDRAEELDKEREASDGTRENSG